MVVGGAALAVVTPIVAQSVLGTTSLFGPVALAGGAAGVAGVGGVGAAAMMMMEGREPVVMCPPAMCQVRYW